MGCAPPDMPSRHAASCSLGTGRSAMAATSSIPGVACSTLEAILRGRSLASFGGVPALEQWSRSAMNRVAGGQRDRSYTRQGARVIGRAGTAHIRALSARVGADDEEVRAGSLILVGDAGRDHDDIAGAQFHCLSALATESHADPTGSDAEHSCALL